MEKERIFNLVWGLVFLGFSYFLLYYPIVEMKLVIPLLAFLGGSIMFEEIKLQKEDKK